MAQKQRIIQLAIPATVLLSLLVGVYFIAWRRFAKPASAPTIVRRSTNTSSEDALKYWNVDKMRAARPAEMPNVKALKRSKKSARKSKSQHS